MRDPLNKLPGDEERSNEGTCQSTFLRADWMEKWSKVEACNLRE
jgi:hypothetical protein